MFHEEMTGLHDPRAVAASIRDSVGLVKRLAVDVHDAIDLLHPLPRQTDHSLDDDDVGILRNAEGDDVTSGWPHAYILIWIKSDTKLK